MNNAKWIAVAALATVLLSGCGTQTKTDGTASAAGGAAPASSSGQSAAKQDQQAQTNGQSGKQRQGGMMNDKERQMDRTFQTIVMMDKKDGLSITKEQAQVMLPIVQSAITKKELAADEQTKLTEKLTDAQKKFITDAEAAGPGARGGGSAAGDNKQLTDEQKQKMEQRQEQRKEQAQAGGTQQQGQPPAGGGQQGQGQGQGQRQGGSFNPGEQLVELLQAKLK